VVEQFASAVLGISDHAAVMVNGRIALAGPPGDGFVEQLSALYLGGTPAPVKPKVAVRPIPAPVPPRQSPAGNGAGPAAPARPVVPAAPTRAPAPVRPVAAPQRPLRAPGDDGRR
jgi:hypothetical protein